MGADFSSHRLYCRDRSAAECRSAAAEALRRSLRSRGYHEVSGEDSANRSFVLEQDGRWLLVGDTAGSTEAADPAAFEAISLDLSRLAPVVDVQMSDSAAIHICLYREGRLVDRFGNMAFPFFRFASPEEAASWQAEPQRWRDLLLDPTHTVDLRAIWNQDHRATTILSESARLFGWHPALAWVGYTHDDEGIWTKYDEYLEGEAFDFRDFEEMHFAMDEVTLPASPYALRVPNTDGELIVHREGDEDYVLLFESFQDAEAYARAAAKAYQWMPLVETVSMTNLWFRMARYKPADGDQVDVALPKRAG